MSNRTRKSKPRKARKTKKTEEEKMDFDTWFWFQMKDGRLQDYQKREIKVFFDSKGLKDKEIKSKYDETLKLY